jgi:predicted outer membrane lipoprotein
MVGGHQPSSAAAVTIMTALWFAHLRAGDQVTARERCLHPPFLRYQPEATR